MHCQVLEKHQKGSNNEKYQNSRNRHKMNLIRAIYFKKVYFVSSLFTFLEKKNYAQTL